LLIQSEIELKHMHSGFAKQAELTWMEVTANQTSNLIFGKSASARDSGYLIITIL